MLTYAQGHDAALILCTLEAFFQFATDCNMDQADNNHEHAKTVVCKCLHCIMVWQWLQGRSI